MNITQTQITSVNNIVKSFKKGGSIYIKSENKGKFTATKKRTGKSTEELKNSKDLLTRKRATFAANAKKWKHKNGGSIDFLQPLIEQFQQGGNIKSTNLQPVTISAPKKVNNYFYKQPADSIEYTGVNNSIARSNTIDLINSNKSTMDSLLKQGLNQEGALQKLLQFKGAIKIGTSKKYPGQLYDTSMNRVDPTTLKSNAKFTTLPFYQQIN